MRPSKVGVEGERLSSFGHGLVMLPHRKVCEAQYPVRLSIVVVESHRPLRQLVRLAQRFVGIMPAVGNVQYVYVGQYRMRPCELPVEFDSLLQETARFLIGLLAALHLQLAASEIVVVGLKVIRAFLVQALLLTSRQLHRKRRDDLPRDLILNREHVGQVAVVLFSPQMATGRTVDKLRDDPDSIARLADTAFQYIANPKLAAYVLHLDGLTPVYEGRVT